MPASGCKQRGKLVDKTKWENKCCNDRLWITSNPQLIPSTSFLQVHVLSLLNLYVI